jgi:hypothetical protein
MMHPEGTFGAAPEGQNTGAHGPAIHIAADIGTRRPIEPILRRGRSDEWSVFS